jgi:hypothetical protein
MGVWKGRILPKPNPYPDWEKERDEKEAKKHLEEHPEDDNLPWEEEDEDQK